VSNPRDSRHAPAGEDLSAEEIAEVALDHLANLTGKQVVGITAVAPTEDGWVVEVEVIEDHRIPSTSDILAVYEARLDSVGDLLSYRRTHRYGRSRSDSANGGGW
jgi:hypothetical protein